jgi:hypothetical protein
MIMDRSVIQERLAETEEQITNGENQIAQQRRLIAELETNGSPASHAKYLLAGLELLQTARRDSRNWLQKQLDAVMAPRPKPLAKDGGCPPYDDEMGF